MNYLLQRTRAVCFSLALTGTLSSAAQAAIKTWDGAPDATPTTASATNTWSTADNWVGDTVPVAGDDLVFPAGALNLSNVNDFANGTVFNSITVNAPGYTLATTVTNSLTLTAGMTADYNAPATGQTAANTISVVNLFVSSTATLTKSGTGVLQMLGPKTFSGTSLTGGTIVVRRGDAIGNTTLTMSDGTTFRMESTLGGAGLGNAISAVTNPISLATGATATITSNATGNSYNGSVTGDAGSTLIFNTFVPIGGSAGTITLGADTQQFANHLGTVRVEPGASLRFAGSASQNNGGSSTTFTVNGNLSTGRGGNIALGAFQGFAPGALTGAILAAGTTTYNIGGKNLDTTFSNIINNGGIFGGTGSQPVNINKIGTGILTLSGNSIYTGATSLSVGTLKVGNNNALGFGNALLNSTNTTGVASDAILDLNSRTVSESISLNGGTLLNNGATAAILSSGLSTIGFSDGGSGISSGATLAISGGGGTGAIATAVLGVTPDSFTISNGGSGYVTAPSVTIAGTGGTGATATSIISGGVVTGINVTNPGNGFTSAPTITFGAAPTGGTRATGTGNTANFTLSRITLTNAGSGYTSAPTVTLSSGTGAVFTPGLSSVALTANSLFAGTGALNIAGNFTNSGADNSVTNNNAGLTTLSGNVNLSESNTGRTLTLGGTGNTTITGTVLDGGTAAGSLTKVGASTLTLRGANTYTGATTVDAGTLLVNNTTGSGTGIGAVGVNSGATLGGNGTISGAATLAVGATHAPGVAGPSIQNTGDYVSNGTLSVDLNGATAGSGYDQVNVTGTVDITNATLSLSSSGYSATVGDTLTLINNDGADAVVGTFSGLAQGATVNLSGNSFTISYTGGDGNDIVLTATASAATSGAIISEFRFIGPGGASDQYVELYNTTNAPLNISNWSIRTSTGGGLTQDTLVPANTIVPAYGHFLFTGAGYGLTTYGASDAAIGADAANDSGVALFNAVGAVQDAAGFDTSLTTLREGAGLASAPSGSVQHAFMRRFKGQLPVDTGDNAADFLLLTTDGAAVAGTSIAPQLGAPNPEGLASPVNINAQIGVRVLDANFGPNVAPNRVRNGSGNGGSLVFRRIIKNNGTQPLSRIRLLVTDITGQVSPVVAGQADVRLTSQADENVAVAGQGTVLVYGTTLEAPSIAPTGTGLTTVGGGGIGSSVNYDIVLTTPLAAGAERPYTFNVQVAKTGSFFININVLGK